MTQEPQSVIVPSVLIPKCVCGCQCLLGKFIRSHYGFSLQNVCANFPFHQPKYVRADLVRVHLLFHNHFRGTCNEKKFL